MTPAVVDSRGEDDGLDPFNTASAFAKNGVLKAGASQKEAFSSGLSHSQEGNPDSNASPARTQATKQRDPVQVIGHQDT